MSEKGEELARHFLAHRAITQDLAERIPDDRVGYAPWDGALAVGPLLLHIANAHHALTATAAGETAGRPDRASPPASLPDIRRHLARLTEEDAAALRSMTEEQLQELRQGLTGSGASLTMTAQDWVRIAREHEVHHKGQLFTYARIMGVQPPAWIRAPRT